MNTREDLLHRHLPKWPQCVVTGTKISKEQALEIIRRTDCFFNLPPFANDRRTAKKIVDILHIPDYDAMKHHTSGSEDDDKQWRAFWDANRKWQDDWGYMFLHYLSNDWILCDMAQGCQGWCNPNGVIDYHFNIGKWPESTEVLEELELIAKTWPFLELECTLYSEEYCSDEESHPIISFLVRNGEVEVIDPAERNIHKEFGRSMWKYTENEEEIYERCEHIVYGSGSDSMISLEIIQKWAEDHLV